MAVFDRIIAARGLEGRALEEFLSPKYESSHDPFLLPDMELAVERLIQAQAKDEYITIYGDYDIDGLTASTLLVDALTAFGLTHVDVFIPNRFVEGYGMTIGAVDKIAQTPTSLIITVDCGSLSEKEIAYAKDKGIDVVVTDHHNVAPIQPPAVAVINPKRLLQDHPDDYEKLILKSNSPQRGLIYPFLDLAGVGVAFNLVQALQTRLDGLAEGQEKWLLDLVALGTVCDVVTLVDENRVNVFWGLKVMSQTRRPGLRALMSVAGIEPEKLSARSLGFGLGPRMNAAGRLETAQYALDMLQASDAETALEKARLLDDMNRARRADQDKIFEAATIQAQQYEDDPVLVVSSSGWNHGIIGIVAAKLLEKYKKPTYVLEEMGEESKGSARSYGDFSAADAIRACDDIITKGGGHTFAAGVTMPTKNIPAFRERVNQYYRDQKLIDQQALLLPKADTTAELSEIAEDLIDQIATLEPFGSGNPEPVVKVSGATVVGVRRMGSDGQHVKLTVRDSSGATIQMLAFNAADHFFCEIGDLISIWFQPSLNEWNGSRSVEGRLLHLEPTQ